VTVSDKLPMVGIPAPIVAPDGTDAALVDAAASQAVAASASPSRDQPTAATPAEGADDSALAARTAAATAGAIPARDIPVIAASAGTASVTPSAMAATSVLEPRVQNATPANDAKASDTPTAAADVRAAAILASTPRPQLRTATATRESATEPTPAAAAPEATDKSASADAGLLPAETPPEPRAAAAPSVPDKPPAPAVAAQTAPASDPALLQAANNQPQATPAQAFTALTAVVNNAQPFSTSAAEQAVPMAGLAVEIAARAKGGTSRFDIRLDPPELGRVDVRMNVDSTGQVTTHLVVERAETLDLLRRDAPQLQQALQDSGLKTGDSALQFSLRDQSQRQTPNAPAEPAVKLVIQPEDTLPPEIAGRSYGRMPSASGGLDIRV
jgi:chemotaxis protein MotD